MVQGALLTAGVGASVKPVKIDCLEDIQGLVGGNIDAVRVEVADNLMAVGYVHDEGLLLNMETNWLASALFQQEIRGDVVVVNGYSPYGEYDGENYDLPTGFIKYLSNEFTARVRDTYNESVAISLAMGFAISNGSLTTQEADDFMTMLHDYVENGGTDKEQGKRIDEMINNIIGKATNEMLGENAGEKLVSEIEEFLKGENK